MAKNKNIKGQGCPGLTNIPKGYVLDVGDKRLNADYRKKAEHKRRAEEKKEINEALRENEEPYSLNHFLNCSHNS